MKHNRKIKLPLHPLLHLRKGHENPFYIVWIVVMLLVVRKDDPVYGRICRAGLQKQIKIVWKRPKIRDDQTNGKHKIHPNDDKFFLYSPWLTGYSMLFSVEIN